MSVFSTVLRCLSIACLVYSVASQCHEGTTFHDMILRLPFFASFTNILTWEDCFFKCFTYMTCQSINYYPDNHTCFTLLANHHGNHLKMLVPTPGAVYSTNPKSRCDQYFSPCCTTNKCTGETSPEGSKCQCMDALTGEGCEINLICKYVVARDFNIICFRGSSYSRHCIYWHNINESHGHSEHFPQVPPKQLG